jgi:hypothetical protein
MFVRRGGILAVVCLTALLPACGSGRKPVFPVRGQILGPNQRPALGALVVFHPVNPDPADPVKPLGRVDDKGRFTLTTYQEGDGAPAGEYVITVTWPVPKKTPFDAEGGDQLQGRYANPQRSALRFSVEKVAENEVPVIRLQVPEAE